MKPVGENYRGIQCDFCFQCFHLKCNVLSVKEYNYFSRTNDLWLCLYCRSEIFPFTSLQDHELVEQLVFNSNTECLCSDNISRLKMGSLPSFDISTLINHNSTLSSIDTDLQLPSLTKFGYYSIHEFHSNEDIQSTICPRAFSVLHFNIRSLAANFDAFHQMLSDMNHSFSITGLSETKINVGVDPYINTDLPGYCFLSQSSMSNARGVGFYVKNNLSYTIRDELCTTQPEFESIWVEFEVPHEHNIVCGLIYRHPESKLDKKARLLNI